MATSLDLECIVPNRIKIGYMYYDIVIQDQQWSDDNSADGLCDHDKRVITIVDSWDLPTVIDTLKHEILHALWYYFDLSDKDKEEHIVTVLARGLTQVEYDNPEYLRLLKMLKDAN